MTNFKASGHQLVTRQRNGKDGRSVSKVDVVYQRSTSSTSVPTTWDTTAPKLQEGYYLWSATKVTYKEADGKTTTEVIGAQCIASADNLKATVERYAQTTSRTTPPDNSSSAWQEGDTSGVQAKDGYYTWTQTKIVWQDGTITYTTPICITGDKGKDGMDGADGCIQRVTEWASGIEFHNDEELTSGTRFLDIAVITESATSFKAYKCLKTHVSSSSNAPQAGVTTEYWEPFNSMAPIYTPMIMAQYALLRLAQTNQLLVMKADGKTVNAAMGGGTYPLWVGATEGANAPFRVDENGKLYATGAEISGTVNATDGTFKGKLNGVSGTFYKLSALDANGKEACTIYFSSDGHMTFEGDLYNQGYNTAQGRSYRFYTSDVWCRGQFGASERNVLVVNGTYGYYYTKGMAYRGTYVSFTKKTSSNNITYYVLPMNGTSGDYAGFPVDVVVFNINSSTVYNYELLMYNSQRVLVVNANDEQDNVKIFSNGDLVTWLGGEMAEVIKLANVMRPTPDSSLIGCGLMVGAFRDNNW